MLLHRVAKYALIAFAGIILAACASQMEPAQKLIGDIESTVAAASADAAKYVPDQLQDVQTKLGELKASFDKKDYGAVVAGAPAVLSAAQGLSSAAAAKKDQVTQELNDEWTSLAAAVTGDLATIQSRTDLLAKKSSKKLAAGIDLDAAKASVSDATSLWSKAQAAFAAGNLDEAVATAKDVKVKIEAVAQTLKVDLAKPAAPAAIPPS